MLKKKMPPVQEPVRELEEAAFPAWKGYLLRRCSATVGIDIASSRLALALGRCVVSDRANPMCATLSNFRTGSKVSMLPYQTHCTA